MNNVRLVKASAENAELIHSLQKDAFMPLYERYHDDGTSPALETVSGVAEKIAYSDFLIIYLDDTPVGGVRVRRFENDGDADKWMLATIEEDARNCHFYEKHGFVRTGNKSVINELMTIIGYEKRC